MPDTTFPIDRQSLAALSQCLNYMLSETGDSEFSSLVGISKKEGADLMAKLQKTLADK